MWGAWPSDRFGIQLAFTRDAMTSDAAAGRATSIRLEPGVVLALFDHVSDYVWIRPVRRVRAESSSPDVEGLGARRPGVRVGQRHRVSRLRWQRADVPGRAAIGLSAELGYRRFQTTFPGFEADTLDRVDRRTRGP